MTEEMTGTAHLPLALALAGSGAAGARRNWTLTNLPRSKPRRAPVGFGHGRDPARACDQLGVGAVGSRPAPLLVVLDLARHIARWQVYGVVYG